MRYIYACSALLLLLSACSHPSQNEYDDKDVGHNANILFGKIISERQVDIKGENTGVGTLAGAAAGGVGASAIGQGTGSLISAVGGAIVGGVAGHFAEQALQDRQGVEYIITYYKTGQTQSIVQNIAKTDKPITLGECVMVQMSGNYQRVLPSPDLSQCH